MPLNPALVKSQFLNRLKVDTAGAAVRALLGDAGNSVIEADDLKQRIPLEPFIVLRAGNIGGAQFDIRQCVLTWWVYDAVPKRHVRINPIIAAIQAAYPLYTFAIGELRSTNISQEISEDAAVGKRPSRSIQYTYTTRR